MTGEEIQLLREATPERSVRVVVSACAYACCGRGWQRRDGYEQVYHGYVQNLTEPAGEADGTFMLYSAGIGTISYVIACRFGEVDAVDRLGQ